MCLMCLLNKGMVTHARMQESEHCLPRRTRTVNQTRFPAIGWGCNLAGQCSSRLNSVWSDNANSCIVWPCQRIADFSDSANQLKTFCNIICILPPLCSSITIYISNISQWILFFWQQLVATIFVKDFLSELRKDFCQTHAWGVADKLWCFNRNKSFLK